MIPRELFKDCIEALQKQYEKEIRFADFMEEYLDGRCVPTLSDDVQSALVNLLSYVMEPTTAIHEGWDTWVEWWVYEKDFGRDIKIKAFDENDKEISLNTVDELYDYLVANYGV